jgi:hypothetical protein
MPGAAEGRTWTKDNSTETKCSAIARAAPNGHEAAAAREETNVHLCRDGSLPGPDRLRSVRDGVVCDRTSNQLAAVVRRC